MKCECCGEPGETGSMPYGIYCRPCGDDVAHPTGDGSCYVEDGREHKARRQVSDAIGNDDDQGNRDPAK